YEVKMEFGDEKSWALLVSDGKEMVFRNDSNPDNPARATPADLNKKMNGLLLTIGAMMATNATRMEAEKIDELLTKCEFKLGAKEKVGAVQAQVIELLVKDDKATSTITLWVDPATGLPVKHKLVDNNKTEMVEVYSEFMVDPKL